LESGLFHFSIERTHDSINGTQTSESPLRKNIMAIKKKSITPHIKTIPNFCSMKDTVKRIKR
jgi:hypothetical protein